MENEAEDYGARARRLIDKAKISGIPMVSMQAGRRTQIEDVDREIEAAAKGIDAQAEYARTVGIKIVMEMPHVWNHYHNVERFKQMLSDLQSDNVGVILDSTYWHISGYDIDDYVNFLQGVCGTFTCGMLPERIRPRVTMNWKKHPERVRWILSYWEKLCTNMVITAISLWRQSRRIIKILLKLTIKMPMPSNISKA